MKPLAEALALLLFMGPVLPASAQVWNEETQTIDYVDDQGNVQGSTPATSSTDAAAEKPASDTGASGGVEDLQKMYDKAIASEKESGKTMVWDGDKMVPAPDNLQNPLTPDAMAKGWRPVVVGGEVVGACNGSECTAQGLQPDLFGPPSSGTTADNQNTAANGMINSLLNGGDKGGGNLINSLLNPAGGNSASSNIQIPCAPSTPNCLIDNKKETPPAANPEPSQGNKEAVTDFVTQNATNELAGQNDPNSGTGSPNYGSADNPMTGLAFAPDGSGAFDLPPSAGSTGGKDIGMSGMVAQGNGGDAGRAINCKQAGNCEAVAQSLIDFHEGLKRGRVDGPDDPNAISVAQTSERLRSSAAYREAVGIQERSASGVAAISGALADGAQLDDQGANDAGANFDGTGANRAAIPTKKCSRHIMGRVGVCPDSSD